MDPEELDKQFQAMEVDLPVQAAERPEERYREGCPRLAWESRHPHGEPGGYNGEA
jgi:hypothetical protein